MRRNGMAKGGGGAVSGAVSMKILCSDDVHVKAEMLPFGASE